MSVPKDWITKSKSVVEILGVKKQSPKRRSSRRRQPIDPWLGYESELKRVRELATICRDTDDVLGQLPSVDALDAVWLALCKPEAPNISEAHAAADAQRALRDYTAFLVKQKGFDFYVVRKEWATILNNGFNESSDSDSELS